MACGSARPVSHQSLVSRHQRQTLATPASSTATRESRFAPTRRWEKLCCGVRHVWLGKQGYYTPTPAAPT
eukprot:4157762-Prorocentrum_lima.AAC.1